jgi:hypothetical protein
MVLKVYIGWDEAEEQAFAVAEASLRRRASIPVDVIPLRADILRMHGLLRRPVDARGGLYDLGSQAPMATEFANSRFLVPLLAHSGPALFVDCDVVFLGDVAELLVGAADPTKAVYVVKHDHAPAANRKMCGAAQTTYARKNWSSVCLWNCAHPALQRLTLDAINNWPGRALHAFSWLHDAEIGALPAGWNWLVNEQPAPPDVRLAHFTNGGPWLPDWQPAQYDEIWVREYAQIS